MSLEDITDSKNPKEELQRLNRSLRALSECNHALVRASNEATLVEVLCRILVETGGYRMAWIGFAEEDKAKSVRPVAQAGFEDGYLDTVNITWADTERGRGPTGSAIRTGQPVIARNIQADPALTPWREAAVHRGYDSSAALPLKRDGRVFGALSVYAAGPAAFDAEEVRLLCDLADDLAYGITALRRHVEHGRAEDARRTAEQRLVESERKYRELVEHANSIILRWTCDGRITFLNEFGQKFFGYSSEEILGRHVIGTIVPETDSCGRDLGPPMEQILADPKAFERNVNENIRRSGELALIAWTNKIVPDEHGRIAEVLSIGVDITELKQAQEEIKERNAELSSINRIITALTGFLDLESALYQVLEEALDLVGLEGGSVCLVTQDDRLELTANRAASDKIIRDLNTNSVRVGECMCGECARTLELLIFRNRKEVLPYPTRESTREDPIHFHASFPLVSAGRCVGVLCVFTRTSKEPPDQRLKLLETFTGQVALAIENAQLYDTAQRHTLELERLVAERTSELAHAKDRAEAADHLKSAFLAAMSHELRTPLNSIIGFTGIILQGLAGPLNPEQTKQLSMVRSSARHLLALINDVLDISKIEAGQLEVSSERFNLRASITKVLGIVTPLAAKKGLAVRTHITTELEEAVGDQRRVEQILLNLLNNAIKFTDIGEVCLTAQLIPDFKSPGATSGQRSIQFSVSDTGIGIRPKDLTTLFQAFRQIDSGLSRNHEGTGLGLAICRRLADLMGGEISVVSAWNKGSTFSFALPLKESSLS
jgi:PAS domain S-box-containing protein